MTPDEPTNHVSNFSVSWTEFLQNFKIDNIQGVAKVFVQKSYDASRSWTHLVFYNHLFALLGQNRVGVNFGYNFFTNLFYDKFWIRRTLMWFSRPLFLIASVSNPHDWKSMIPTLSSGCAGWWLNYKKSIEKHSIYLSKRNNYTFFSMPYRNYLLKTWKEYFNNPEVFELPIPLPPVWEHQIPVDMDLGIAFLNRIVNLFHQVGKIIRYFIDVQISTIESSMKGVYSSSNLKMLFLSKFYEQFYILSFGFQTRTIVEYAWNETKKSFRFPFEFSWGCDIIRIWALLDLFWEFKEELKATHTLNVAITVFEVYTLFEYTLSLNPYWKWILGIFKKWKAEFSKIMSDLKGRFYEYK
jgi:hypothetical protein